MPKKSNTRKTAALGLAFLGLAGVTVASAATLTLNDNGSSAVQAGTIDVDGVCQDTDIDVSFTLNGSTPGQLVVNPNGFGYPADVDAIVLTAIDAACAGKNIEVALGDSLDNKLGEYFSADAVAGALTISLATEFDAVVDAADVAQVSVTIYD